MSEQGSHIWRDLRLLTQAPVIHMLLSRKHTRRESSTLLVGRKPVGVGHAFLLLLEFLLSSKVNSESS